MSKEQIAAWIPTVVDFVIVVVVPLVGVALRKWLKAKAAAEHSALLSQACAAGYWVAEQVARKSPAGSPVNKLAVAIGAVAQQLGRDLTVREREAVTQELKAIHEARRAGSIALDGKTMATPE